MADIGILEKYGAPVGYPEYYDNVSTWADVTCDKRGVGWFITGECDNGHRIAKELVCGKEWCSVCGEDGSIAHMRRFSRWLSKIMQSENIGYFVFTIPVEARERYRSKRALAKLGHDIQELLKSVGYTRGLRRWHFFGDKSVKWNPHLNLLVDSGFVSEKKMEIIKKKCAFVMGIDLAKVNVNYRYRRSPGKMIHTLKYITRATFHDYEWDMEMSLELRGFRNMVVWGRGQWNEPAVWSIDDLGGKGKTEIEGLDIEAIDNIVNRICPVCKLDLKWGKALPIGLLNMVEKESYGAGYYRLADIRPPPELPDDIKQKLYWMQLLHRVEVRIEAECIEREAVVEAEYQSVLWSGLLN